MNWTKKVLHISMFLGLLIIGMSALAQSDRSPKPVSEAEGNIGKVISNYASLISPDAFKGKWENDFTEWIQTVSQYGINDMGEAKIKISELINNLKSSALASDKRSSLLLQTVGANGAGDIRKILSELLAVLDPSFVMGEVPSKMELPRDSAAQDSLEK